MFLAEGLQLISLFQSFACSLTYDIIDNEAMMYFLTISGSKLHSLHGIPVFLGRDISKS